MKIIYSILIIVSSSYLLSQTFEEHIVSLFALDAFYVDAADIDGDGDMDLMSASRFDDKISWYENNGNQNFTEHILTTNANHAHSVLASDLNSDGLMDIIGCSRDINNIVWFENLGNHQFYAVSYTHLTLPTKRIV